MSDYRIAGIDVHKKMLAVVVADVAGEGNYTFERQMFGATSDQLQALTRWLAERNVKEAVMESTAQYWKPVWREIEAGLSPCKLHLAQAFSNRAPRGRKEDFRDAERLVRRHVAGELTLSFVPGAEQQLWRTVAHTKHQLTRDKARLANQFEALLEDCHIKLSSVVSQLLGVSSRRMLKALAQGETDPAKLAAMADSNLRAGAGKLCLALSAAATLDPARRKLLKITLERLDLLEKQIGELETLLAELLRKHSDAVARLAEIPGLGVDSAQQIIAEVGPEAATFATADNLASWVGVCPGREVSAAVSASDRSPKGNQAMRRVLNQCANAAVKAKGSIFEVYYARGVPRLGHNKAVWSVAHKLCTVVWVVLHGKKSYKEFGPRPNLQAVRKRASRLATQLRRMGYTVIPPSTEVLA
jgi:transposase